MVLASFCAGMSLGVGYRSGDTIGTLLMPRAVLSLSLALPRLAGSELEYILVPPHAQGSAFHLVVAGADLNIQFEGKKLLRKLSI